MDRPILTLKPDHRHTWRRQPLFLYVARRREQIRRYRHIVAWWVFNDDNINKALYARRVK